MKRIAFTLAEVLIVLGIIGIVAAMTIPTLMNKIQKHEYVVGLKKEYSMLNSGFAHILADEGVDKLEDTSVFRSIPGYAGIKNAKLATYKTFYDNLKKYFRFSIVTAPSYQLYNLNGTKNSDHTGETVLAFDDGFIMFNGEFFNVGLKASTTVDDKISSAGGHFYRYQGGGFYFDINGFKKPNTWGRDIFEFWLSSDGKLYPRAGKDYSLYWNGNLIETWQNRAPGYCGTPDSSDVKSAQGLGCGARVMEEGWEMNY